MKRQFRRVWLMLLPVMALAISASLLGEALAMAPSQGASIPIPECQNGLLKSADPAKLFVGDETTVTTVVTGTCPAYELPIDLVLVVDKSNSMTKGQPGRNDGTPGNGSVDPTPNAGDFPTSIIPEPKPTDDPGVIPTAFAPGQDAGQASVGRVHGISQIGPPPTTDPRATPKPTDDPSGANPTPTKIDGGNDIIRRGEVEAAGTEDNIRAMQESVGDFLDSIQDDVKAGRIRVSLVQFDERGRSLVTLSDNVSKVRSQLSRIRGGNNTRIDLGVQAGQRELVGATVRGRTDQDHAKVMIVWSDGFVDPRTVLRLRTRDQVKVIAVGVGRNANTSLLSKVATERKWVFRANERSDIYDAFASVAPSMRQITIPKLDVTEKLMPGMELVAGSVSPAPALMPDAQTMIWHAEPVSFPMTFTYRVRPLEPGILPLSEKSNVVYTDSEKRPFDLPFPELKLEVKRPGDPDLMGSGQ